MIHWRLQWQPPGIDPCFYSRGRAERERDSAKPQPNVSLNLLTDQTTTMAKPKVPILKPVLGVVGMTDGVLLQRLNAVHDGMFNNPAYPSPPVDMPSYKSAIDAFTAASAATLDGGKAAITLRDKRRTD